MNVAWETHKKSRGIANPFVVYKQVANQIIASKKFNRSDNKVNKYSVIDK